MPHLNISTSGGDALTLPLEGGEALIGRSTECRVCILDSGISRIHARLVQTRHGATLEDLGSTGGTRVNGLPLTRPLPLVHGDRITVGNTEIVYADDDPPPAHPARIPAAAPPDHDSDKTPPLGFMPPATPAGSPPLHPTRPHRQEEPGRPPQPPPPHGLPQTAPPPPIPGVAEEAFSTSEFSRFAPITQEELPPAPRGGASGAHAPSAVPTFFPPPVTSPLPPPSPEKRGHRRRSAAPVPEDVLLLRRRNRRLAKVIIYGGLIIPFLIADVIIVHVWLKRRRAQQRTAEGIPQRTESSYHFTPHPRGSHTQPHRQAPPRSGGSITPPSDPGYDLDGAWPLDAASAGERQRHAAATWGIPLRQRILLPGDVAMDFVLIPPGAFRMGSPAGEPGRRPEDKGGLQAPVRRRITHPYYMAVHACTQSQWRAVTGMEPHPDSGGDHPVEGLGWSVVQNEFLPAIQRHAPAQMHLALPTEAQWEYAARAGSAEAFHGHADGLALDAIAWHEDNSGGVSHPVGGKMPNAWGLYDMHGNVWEWCRDLFQRDAYLRNTEDDPLERRPSPYHVLRGGSHLNPPSALRAAHRHHLQADSSNPAPLEGVGFRLVLEFKTPPPRTGTEAAPLPRR